MINLDPNDIGLFVLDMDGTFYLSDDIIDGSLEFYNDALAHGKKVLFFTNNSSKNKLGYIDKLAKMGCNITADDIMTSGDVTTRYINTYYPGKSVYLLGTPALEEAFLADGISLVNAPGKGNASKDDVSETPDIVCVGFDMTLTYEKLERACTFIRNGAVYLATHPDINCPVKDGFIPDCGAFIAAINLSTGKTPKVLGKPNFETLEMIMNKYSLPKEKIAFVGDRIYTDVATGVTHGAKGILVMSGETDEAILNASEIKPDAVYGCLGDIKFSR